jgi:ABC-2 type transport system ATP-binding protein
MNFALELQNVFKSFGKITVLNDLSFSIAPGETVGYLGINGAGKTTTIKLANDIFQPNSGSISIFGKSVGDIQSRSVVGCTPQSFGLGSSLSVAEVLFFITKHYQNTVPLAELKTKFDLEKVWGNKTKNLSGGELRRVGLAAAFCGKPKLAFLDEPTTGLDAQSRHQLWDIIEENKNKYNTTVFLTTHYLTEIESLCSRILILNQGSIWMDGSVQDIKEKTKPYCPNTIIFKVPVTELSAIHHKIHTDLSIAESMASIKCQDNGISIQTQYSDTVLRYLVQENIPFTDLIIETQTLEDSFLSLQNNQHVSTK